jgi:hypothetical protein
MPMLWSDRRPIQVPYSLSKAIVEHIEASSDDFIAELAEVSRQLGMTSLRCSLFAIRVARKDAANALRRLKNRFERFGAVGMLDNGQIGFLYLDRCCLPERDDAAITDSIRQQVADALEADSLKGFVALHYWTDEVSTTDDLVRRLEDRTFRRAASSAATPVAAAAI